MYKRQHFHIPIEVDPPDFRKWRKLINPITAPAAVERMETVSYTHLRAHETVLDLVCRLLLEKKKHLDTKTDIARRYKKEQHILSQILHR